MDQGIIKLKGESTNCESIYASLQNHGLAKYAMELDLFGVTCVPPEITGISGALLERLRAALLRVASKRLGIDLLAQDYRTSTVKFPSDYVGNHWWLLYEDDVFAEIATNPVGLAITRYLLGNSAVLTLTGYFVKPSDTQVSQKLMLHRDQSEPPGSVIQNGINVSVMCSDYLDVGDGPTVFVPGSHKFGRGPMPYESDPETTPCPLIIPKGRAGSMLIFAGGTWHGSIPRTNPGLRVTLLQLYCRRHMRPHHLHDEPEAEALMDRVPNLDVVLGRRDYQLRLPAKGALQDRGALQAQYFNRSCDPYA